jgi:AraC family transcriptional regulator
MDRYDDFSLAETSEAAERPTGASDARSQSRSTVRQLRSVISELLTALASTLNDERDSAKECLSRATVLLQTDGEAREAARPTKGGLAPWQVRTLTSHVETNLDKPIRSSELATVVRLNPAYFCRVFRESFGEPPLQYISRRRVERAQELMLSTNTSLSQIAFDCGFSDQAHFSRLFRRLAGDTPRAWRRAHLDAPAGAARLQTSRRAIEVLSASANGRSTPCKSSPSSLPPRPHWPAAKNGSRKPMPGPRDHDGAARESYCY